MPEPGEKIVWGVRYESDGQIIEVESAEEAERLGFRIRSEPATPVKQLVRTYRWQTAEELRVRCQEYNCPEESDSFGYCTAHLQEHWPRE